jgi:hypothetical protein
LNLNGEEGEKSEENEKKMENACKKYQGKNQ